MHSIFQSLSMLVIASIVLAILNNSLLGQVSHESPLQSNEEILVSLFTKGFNKGDTTYVESYVSNDYQSHVNGRDILGVESMKKAITTAHKNGYQYIVKSVHSCKDKVIVYYKRVHPDQPTDREAVYEIMIARIADSKLAESWRVNNSCK